MVERSPGLNPGYVLDVCFYLCACPAAVDLYPNNIKYDNNEIEVQSDGK